MPPPPRTSPRAQPRVILLGDHVDALCATTDGLTLALAEDVDVRHVRARSPIAAYRRAAAALSRDGFEAVHLLDARLASSGALLRRRFGVPVSVTVNPGRLVGRDPIAQLARHGLRRLDQGFAADHGTVRFLRDRARRVPVVLTPAGAPGLPDPSASRLASVVRALREVQPGRLVIGLPWTADTDYLRWHRDAVAPLLTGSPLCLVLGAPSRRQARLVFGAQGLKSEYRIHTGALDAETVAAAARCVDAFIVPGTPRRPYIEPDLLMALASSGAPVVAGGGVRSSLQRHESNAIVATAGDPLSLVSTLNQLLALPAIQRHYLGEQFAEETLRTHPWRDVAASYVDRFAVLVGRPPIPADLRAA
jgi:hypothetical protein